jgi:hypothetical protein
MNEIDQGRRWLNRNMWNTSQLPNTSLQPTGESGRSFRLTTAVTHSYLVSALLAPAAELHRWMMIFEACTKPILENTW